VLIPVVLRNGCRPAESKLSPDGNHSSGTYKVKNKGIMAVFRTSVGLPDHILPIKSVSKLEKLPVLCYHGLKP
jgi:hypothetical protein